MNATSRSGLTLIAPIIGVWICHGLVVTFYAAFLLLPLSSAGFDKPWRYGVAALVTQTAGIALAPTFVPLTVAVLPVITTPPIKTSAPVPIWPRVETSTSWAPLAAAKPAASAAPPAEIPSPSAADERCRR